LALSGTLFRTMIDGLFDSGDNAIGLNALSAGLN